MIKWYKIINKINWDRSKKKLEEKNKSWTSKKIHIYINTKQEKLLIIFLKDINFEGNKWEKIILLMGL